MEDGADARALANWVTGELLAQVEDGQDPAESKVTPEALARLVGMVGAKQVSHSAAKEVLGTLVAEGGDPARIVDAGGLARADEGELAAIVDRAMADQADAVGARRQREGDRRDRRRGDARDQGPRRRR